jgi:hypothetical protein
MNKIRIDKLAVILFLLIICLRVYSREPKLILESKKLILKTLDYYDDNPIHQAETDTIKNKFREILLRHDNSKISRDYNPDIEMIFKWIYDNGYCEYEDAPDYMRIKIRRAYCFASIALLSDHDKAYTFLELAKLSLIQNFDNPNYNSFENQFLGLLLIEIMLKIEGNQLEKEDITKLQNYLDLNKSTISENNYSDTKRLIEKYKKITK